MHGHKVLCRQIKKLYDGKALPVKEIWTPKGVMKDVAVSFDKRLKEFNFSTGQTNQKKRNKTMTCELSLQTTGKESSLVQMVNNSLSILLHIIISCFSDIYCSVIYFLCF